jgi:hypothetical protein
VDNAILPKIHPRLNAYTLKILSDNMSQASSTSEQLLFTESGLQKCEDSAKQVSILVLFSSSLWGILYSGANGVKVSSTTSGLDDVQGSPKASKGGWTLDTDKTLVMHPSSPLTLPFQVACKDSDADTALAPLSSVHTTEGVTRGDDDNITTSVRLSFSSSLAV